MKLRDIPYYTLNSPKYITQEQKEYLLALGALKSLRNREERIKAKKLGLSEPQKKWSTQEIELSLWGVDRCIS